MLQPVEMKAVPEVDSERRLLESFAYCVTTGPSDAPAGGNICTEGRCAGNGPTHTHTCTCGLNRDARTTIRTKFNDAKMHDNT